MIYCTFKKFYIPFLLCIYNAGQYHRLGCYSRLTGIFIGDKFPLLVYSSNGSDFYYALSLFLEKHARLKNTLLLLFSDIFVVLWFECVSEVQLLCLRFICFLYFSFPTFHACLAGQLFHNSCCRVRKLLDQFMTGNNVRVWMQSLFTFHLGIHRFILLSQNNWGVVFLGFHSNLGGFAHSWGCLRGSIIGW